MISTLTELSQIRSSRIIHPAPRAPSLNLPSAVDDDQDLRYRPYIPSWCIGLNVLSGTTWSAVVTCRKPGPLGARQEWDSGTWVRYLVIVSDTAARTSLPKPLVGDDPDLHETSVIGYAGSSSSVPSYFTVWFISQHLIRKNFV